jgi:hypothetical protein
MVIMYAQGCVRICKVYLSAVISLSYLVAFPVAALTLSAAANQIEAKARERETSKLVADDAEELQQRAFAVSLIISLGNEARGYYDLALRPRVLARAADVVRDSDPVTAQSLFRR